MNNGPSTPTRREIELEEQLRRATLDRRQALGELEASRAETDAVLEALRLLTSPAEAHPDVSVLEAIRRLLDVMSAFILRRRHDRLVVVETTDPRYSAASWQIDGVFERSLAGTTLALFDGGLVEEWTAGLPAAVDVTSVLLVPLSTATHDGLLVCTHRDVGRFGPAEVLLAERMSPIAAQTLQQAMMHRALRHERDQLEARVTRRTAELELAKSAAESSDRAKTAFLANMSHEIRTPLNGIMGMAELMLAGQTDPRLREQVEVLQHSGHRLLAIVNDILDLAKVESGTLELREERVEVRRCFERSVEPLRAAAADAGLVLRFRVTEDTPDVVVTDAARVGQVIANLVGNAIKFTDHGGVDVVLTTADDPSLSAGRARFACTVSDTGPGIPAAERERVFERFHQVDDSSTRPHGGAGLGLAISQQLAEMLGGAVELVDEDRPGATFRFTFVVGVDEPSPPADDVVSQPTASEFDGLRVLVAEDDAVNQMVVMAMLRRLGVDADLVADGAAAVAAAVESGHDVVLMDVQMPGLSGIEAARRIRQLRPDRPWIVAATASALDHERRQFIEAGMDDHLPKPISLSSLAESLRRARSESPSGGSVGR